MELLGSGRHSVTETALPVGFESLSAFATSSGAWLMSRRGPFAPAFTAAKPPSV